MENVVGEIFFKTERSRTGPIFNWREVVALTLCK